MQALTTRSFDSRRRKMDKKNMKCHYFGKKCHFRAECRKRKREETNANPQQNDQSSPHAMMCSETSSKKSNWYIDSGVSYHICNDLKLFTSELTGITPIRVHIGDGGTMSAKYSGSVNAIFKTVFGDFKMTLCYVLYIPEASVNLISVAQVQNRAYSVKFQSD